MSYHNPFMVSLEMMSPELLPPTEVAPRTPAPKAHRVCVCPSCGAIAIYGDNCAGMYAQKIGNEVVWRCMECYEVILRETMT